MALIALDPISKRHRADNADKRRYSVPKSCFLRHIRGCGSMSVVLQPRNTEKYAADGLLLFRENCGMTANRNFQSPRTSGQ